jgi:hypothetical protein
MAFTSVDRADLQQAFALAHIASEDPQFSREIQIRFRTIAQLIWRAHGEQSPVPPAGAGEHIMRELADRDSLADLASPEGAR